MQRVKNRLKVSFAKTKISSLNTKGLQASTILNSTKPALANIAKAPFVHSVSKHPSASAACTSAHSHSVKVSVDVIIGSVGAKARPPVNCVRIEIVYLLTASVVENWHRRVSYRWHTPHRALLALGEFNHCQTESQRNFVVLLGAPNEPAHQRMSECVFICVHFRASGCQAFE